MDSEDSPTLTTLEEAAAIASGSTMADVLDSQLIDQKCSSFGGIDVSSYSPEKECDPEASRESVSEWYSAPSHTQEETSTRGALPMNPQTYASLDRRQMRITDALTYIESVKVQFEVQPEVYNHFLDILARFKEAQIGTLEVMQHVSHLFNGHPALIQAFDTFLPVGYRIECSTDPDDTGAVMLTTPSGETMKAETSGSGRTLPWSTGQPTAPSPVSSPMDSRDYGADGQAMEPAVQYVQKIEQRCSADTYRQLLDILSRYHHDSETFDEAEAVRQIVILFKDYPDLLDDFSRFMMPDRSSGSKADFPGFVGTDTQWQAQSSPSSPSPTPGAHNSGERAEESVPVQPPLSSMPISGHDKRYPQEGFPSDLGASDRPLPSTMGSYRRDISRATPLARPGGGSLSSAGMFTNAQVKIFGGTFHNSPNIYEVNPGLLELGGGPAFPITVLGLQAICFAACSHYPPSRYTLEQPPVVTSPSTVHVVLHFPSLYDEMKIVMAPLTLWFFIKMWIQRRAIDYH